MSFAVMLSHIVPWMSSISRKYSVVFFSERNSPFGALHAAALRATRQFDIIAFVVTNNGQSASKNRAAVVSVRDFISRAIDKLLFHLLLTKYRLQSRALVGETTPIMEISQWDEISIQSIKDLQPDIIFSSGYTKILPPQVLEIARMGAYNTHPSALPEYGGNNPWFWILRNRERVSGVTIHKMVMNVDAGNIVMQQCFDIPLQCNYSRLYSISLRKSAGMVKAFARLIQQYGSEVPGRSQVAVSVFPVPNETDYKIEWTLPAVSISALVAASAPAPGAFSLINDEKLTLLSVKQVIGNILTLDPGQLHCREGHALVGCGDGECLRISVARYRGQRLKERQIAELLCRQSRAYFT